MVGGSQKERRPGSREEAGYEWQPGGERAR